MNENEPRYATVAEGLALQFGQTVYDDEGNELGTIRGFDDSGFYVSTSEGVVDLSEKREAESMAGEKELMWRCWECGELGRISDIPASCPSCGAPKEELYYWQED